MPSWEWLSGGFGADLFGGRNFWDGRGYIGIGGSQFDLIQRALAPTGYRLLEGTTWDGEPTLSLVPVYANWGLLSWVNVFSREFAKGWFTKGLSDEPGSCTAVFLEAAGEPLQAVQDASDSADLAVKALGPAALSMAKSARLPLSIWQRC